MRRQCFRDAAQGVRRAAAVEFAILPCVAAKIADAAIQHQIGEAFLAIAADQCRMQSLQTVTAQIFDRRPAAADIVRPSGSQFPVGFLIALVPDPQLCRRGAEAALE